MSNFTLSSLPTAPAFEDKPPGSIDAHASVRADLTRGLVKNILEFRALQAVRTSIGLVRAAEASDVDTALAAHISNLAKAGQQLPESVVGSLLATADLLDYLKGLRKYLLSRLSRRLLRQTSTLYDKPSAKKLDPPPPPSEDAPVALPNPPPYTSMQPYKGWEPTPLLPTKLSSQKLPPNLLTLSPAPSHAISDSARLAHIQKQSIIPHRSKPVSAKFLSMKKEINQDSFDRTTKEMQKIKKQLDEGKDELSGEVVAALHSVKVERDIEADYNTFIVQYEDSPALRSLKKLKEGQKGLTFNGKKVTTIKTSKGYGSAELVNSGLNFEDGTTLKYAEGVLERVEVDDNVFADATGTGDPPVGVIVKRGSTSRAREAKVRKLKRRYDSLNSVRNESWNTMKLIDRAVSERNEESQAKELFEADYE